MSCRTARPAAPRAPFVPILVLVLCAASIPVLRPLSARTPLESLGNDAAAQPASDTTGWQIPPNARDDQNPLPVTPALLKKGKAEYESRCQRCHGQRGKGDGPDGDPEHKPADLSDASRASRNSDGVVFYK